MDTPRSAFWRPLAVVVPIALALGLSSDGFKAYGQGQGKCCDLSDPVNQALWAKFGETGSMAVRGHTLYLNPADKVITTFMVLEGTWEPTETDVFLSLVKEGDTVVDVGANIGYYTVLGAQAVGPTGKIYAFEPDPTNFSFLEKNVTTSKYTNVIAEQKALSNKSEKLKLYLDELNKGDHRIYQPGTRPSIDVDAVKLDDYLPPARRKVDLIKIDTQGAEVVILQGMTETLKHSPTVKVLVEFWPKGLSGFGYNAGQLLDILERENFKCRAMQEDTKTVVDTTRAELLSTFTVENGLFTNLVCSR